MEKSIRSSGTVLILTFALLYLAEAEQFGGTKTGRQQTRTSRPANEPGLCYKRLPYSEVFALNNVTGHVQVVQRDAERFNAKTGQQIPNNDWVTVLDCCDGYVRDEVTGNCTVHCAGGCSGGVCALGGICTCESGRLFKNGVCEPICRLPCHKDAYCSAPDVCTCLDGFEEKFEGQCSPICSSGCENGDCIAFNTCRCKDGYAMNAYQTCEAVCEGGCPNGACTKPGYCTCHSGYVHPPGETEMCQPDCGPRGCPDGECTSPGVCTCQPGYKQDYHTRACVPDCQPGCGEHSHCQAPGRCVCDSGYFANQQTRTCVRRYQQTPVQWPHPQQTDDLTQQTGDFTQQTGDFTQQTGDHYIYDQQTGDTLIDQFEQVRATGPRCDRPCLNAQCTGPNTCTCNPGYMPDPRDPSNSRCVAGCPRGCPNGVCSGPNFCICKPGYVKDRSVKGSQRCVPVEDTH